jgi:hypothetical protein
MNMRVQVSPFANFSECGGMVDAKASKAFHYFNGVGSSPITRTNGFSFFF